MSASETHHAYINYKYAYPVIRILCFSTIKSVYGSTWYDDLRTYSGCIIVSTKRHRMIIIKKSVVPITL